MLTIFCPQCHDLILDQPACPTCGWQRSTAAGDAGALLWQGELGHRLGKPRCYPVIAAGRYCAPTQDGMVVALDLATGDKVWERTLGAGRTTHALATDGERIFVGCADMRPIPAPGEALLALDARSGELVWEYPTQAHSCSAVAVLGGSVFFISSDGLLHCLEARTSQPIWTAAHAAWGPEAPAAGSGLICAGGRGETVVAYSAGDGAELWRFTAGGWFAGEICIAGERVYTVCWDSYLYALGARSGELLWKARGERDRGFTGPPAIAGERVFIGDRVSYQAGVPQLPTYALLALDARDGNELWRFRTGRHIFAPLAITGDTPLFGADDGSVFVLDATSGAARWTTRVDGRVAAQPQVADDLVYVAERNGLVYAFRWRASSAAESLSPETYLRRGEHEQAAVAYALGGQFEAAALLYERQLVQPREAALLYERAGQPGRAAPLWQKLGEPRRARDAFLKAGDKPGLADVLVQLGEPLQAARLYEEAGRIEPAAQLYEQHGDRARAAELYRKAGQIERARAIWESLGQWERLVEDLIVENKPGEAAVILERQEQPERAADLYEQADDLQQALRLRITLAHWERVAALASRMGDHAQAAAAYEQLGQAQPAAAAYERAAQQAAGETRVDEERIATLYERAAQRYSEIYDEERAAACRGQIRRYRHLPELVVAGAAHEAFVEFEWNALTLQVENTGHGVARDVAITLDGAFDVAGALQIASLPAGKSRTLELSMRPHREQYGPKVPLEIVVEYADARGGQHRAVQRHPVHVVRQGAERGDATPLEIRVSAHEVPAQTVPPGQEEIDQQLELLATYRRRLAYHLQQEALLGTAAPFSLIEELRGAREQIRRIKGVLRSWSVAIEDSPNDES
jgi:outer membrane protein assembly factor BamB/tetratricopeptide (TPR) repeat protein